MGLRGIAPRLRRLQIIVSATALGIALTVALLAWLRPASLEAEARSMLDAFVSNDGASLYAFSHDHERRILALNESKVQLLLDRVIRPRLARFMPIGPIESMTVAEGVQASAWQVFEDGSGNRIEITVAPVATESGARQRLAWFLTQAWIADFVVSRGLQQTPENVHRARLAGMKADAPILREIGILGGVSPDPRDPTLLDWDAQIRYAEKRLRDLGSISR